MKQEPHLEAMKQDFDLGASLRQTAYQEIKNNSVD